MSRKILRPRPEEVGRFVLPSSPCVGARLREFPFSAGSSRWRDDVLRLLTQTSSVVVRCQPWFYLRLEAYSFFWLSEGAYGLSRDFVPEHAGPTRLWILTLEPERLKNRRTTARDVIPEMEGFSTDAQAACCFRCSASKRTPFFQTSKVIAAIFRANVRRAIGGFNPLATSAA